MIQTAASYKSLLHQMTQSTSTCLWNDSCSLQELAYATEHGAVGATCNPVIVTRRTLRQFIGACHDLDALIRDLMLPNPDQETL